jgi:hypothetical protein
MCTAGIKDTGGKTTSFASVVFTGGKFSTSVNDTGGKFFRWCQLQRWQFVSGINNNSVNDTGGILWEQYQATETLK